MLRPWNPEYELLVATWTLSRRSRESEPERLTAARAFPVAFTEERLLSNQSRGCFNESLDVGTAYPLTVCVFALLLPSFLLVQRLGHGIGSLRHDGGDIKTVVLTSGRMGLETNLIELEKGKLSNQSPLFRSVANGFIDRARSHAWGPGWERASVDSQQ